MEQAGSRMFRVVRSIKECRIALIEWNKRVKGNSKAKIQELKEKLQAVRKGSDPISRGTQQILKGSLAEPIKMKNCFGVKSQGVDGLKKGTRIQRFFL